MVANGEATVEQLDLSITAGPGLRWALMGPMLTFSSCRRAKVVWHTCLTILDLL